MTVEEVCKKIIVLACENNLDGKIKVMTEIVQDCSNIIENSIYPMSPALVSFMIFALKKHVEVLETQFPSEIKFVSMLDEMLGSYAIRVPVKEDKK